MTKTEKKRYSLRRTTMVQRRGVVTRGKFDPIKFALPSDPRSTKAQKKQNESRRVESENKKQKESRRVEADVKNKTTKRKATNSPSKKDNLKKGKRAKTTATKKACQRTKIRISPRIFVDVVNTLSPAQQNWIRSVGFGGLLHFQLTELPHTLCYNILKHLDHRTISLKLPVGVIKINDVDVKDVLGLPLGRRLIQLPLNYQNMPMVEEWRSQFPNASKWKITATMVADKLKECDDVNFMFKLNWLVLVANSFIECLSNPYVNQQILAFYNQVDQCLDFNWCAYLIRSMVKSQEKWLVDPDEKFYSGPLTFLVLLYVDRVTLNGERTVERKIPTLYGWTESDLKRRQDFEMKDGNFGQQTSISEPARDDQNAQHVVESSDSTPIDVKRIYTECIVQLERCASQVESIITMYNNDCATLTKFFPEDPKFLQIRNRITLFLKKQLMPEDDQTANMPEDDRPASSKQSDEDDQTAHPNEPVTPVNNSPNENTCRSVVPHAPIVINEPPVKDDIEHETDLTQLFRFIDHVVESVLRSESSGSKNKYRSPGDVDPPSFSFGLTQDESDDENKHMNLSSTEDKITDLGENSCGQTARQLDPVEKVDPNLATKTLGQQQIEFDTPPQQILQEPPREKEVLDKKSRRKARPGKALRSPWMERVAEITVRQTPMEALIWNWLFQESSESVESDDSDECCEVAFKWGPFECFLDQFKTLYDDSDIEATVISCWTHVLNNKEQRRSDESPLRFFFTVETTLNTLYWGDDGDDNRRYKRFAERVDNLLLSHPSVKFEEIEMMFFPISAFGHFYIICYNLKNPAWELIDNISNCPSIDEVYMERPEGLHKNFTRYLQEKGHLRANDVKKLTLVRLQMEWQTGKNHHDCGVFVMRHMETYMGQRGSPWKCGLYKEGGRQRRQLNRLRSIYCAEILTSDINEVAGENVRKAEGTKKNTN